MTVLHPRVSLTELLVGVVVIGLLGSIILPALKRAGQEADVAKCRGNLYEIGQAVFLYAADHDGRVPPNVTSSGEVTSEWGTYVADRSLGFLLGRDQGGAGRANYIGRPHRLFCPSYPAVLNETSGFKHPDEINAENPLIRVGYIWTYYPLGDRRSNAHIEGDPHGVLVYDFGPGPFLAQWLTTPSHEAVVNVLHVGGHVNTVPLAEAQQVSTSRSAIYDWLVQQSRSTHQTSYQGGDLP